MRKRGRVSAAETETALVVDPSRKMPASAPSELTDGQADVWRKVVASMPSNFVSKGAHPILIEYCRHVCRARFLERQIAVFEIDWVKAEGGLERFDRLLNMADRETRAMTACARALRLTPQAQMHPRSAARQIGAVPLGPMPWDDDDKKNLWE